MESEQNRSGIVGTGAESERNGTEWNRSGTGAEPERNRSGIETESEWNRNGIGAEPE